MKQGACGWERLGKAMRISQEGDQRLDRGDVSADMGDVMHFRRMHVPTEVAGPKGAWLHHLALPFLVAFVLRGAFLMIYNLASRPH